MIDLAKALSFGVVVGCWLVPSPSLHAQNTEFPYRAVVRGDEAVVRSGPGTSHYGTDRLPAGSEVEVYRHDPGGWIAIRPPDGSFSLVRSDQVELVSERVAKVTREGAMAWVGTALNSVENPMWQVKLKQGETLRVLGTVDRQKYNLAEDEPDWIQIAPPAGEFRWIAKADIQPLANSHASTDPSSGGVEGESPTESNAVPFEPWDDEVPASNEWRLDVESKVAEPSKQTDGGPTSTDSGWKPARQTITNFVEQRSDFVAESQATSEVTGQWAMTGTTQARTPDRRSELFDADSTASGAAGALLPPQFASGAEGLSALEMQLTQEMLKPPAEWNFQPLALQIQRIQQESMDPQDRQVATRLLNKIRKCNEIKAGFQAAAPSERPVDLQTSRIQRLADDSDELLHHYDAYGYLNQLVRDGGRGPTTWVLQDDQGRITHHVAAPPGLNMRRYLHQRVGIIGHRGYHQQLELDHVTAERVVGLDRLRR